MVFSLSRDKVLFLRRSNNVGTYQGKWSCVSGHVEEEDTSTEERARKELQEETGIENEDIKKLIPAGVQQVRDGSRDWEVYVFLVLLKEGRDKGIELDWENTEHQWLGPEKVKELATVPDLDKTVDMAISTIK